MVITCVRQFVCWSLSWYQQLNRSPFFNEIQHRNSLRKLSNKQEFRESRLSESHTILKGVI